MQIQDTTAWWARYATNPDHWQFYIRAHAEAKRMAPLTVGDLIDRSYKETLLKQQSRREAL